MSAVSFSEGGRPTRAVVDLSAIARNYRRIRTLAGEGTRVVTVLKADAYGHGAVPVARRLAAEGVDHFAVAILEEGIALRRAGIGGQILLLNHSEPSRVDLLQAYGLTPALHDLGQAAELAAAAESLASPLPVHLKIDTGMSRLGVSPSDLGAVADLLKRSRGLALKGTFTQFARADDPDPGPTRAQIATMTESLQSLRAARIDPGMVHLANSAAVLRHPDARFDAVRPGLALYGISPFETDGGDGDFEPALTLETRVMVVRRVGPGDAVGYGAGFVAVRPATIAVLPIGYDDGVRRSFSGRVSILLRGERAPIVGAVSMDLTTVDATACGANPGDRAVLLGEDARRRVTAWDLARAAGTIPWEILCGIGARVPRVYS